MKTVITIESSVSKIHKKLISNIKTLVESYNLCEYSHYDVPNEPEELIFAENTQEITLPKTTCPRCKQPITPEIEPNTGFIHCPECGCEIN